MTDLESRLRTMDLRPPGDLQARALAGAAWSAPKPRSRLRLAVPAVIVAALLAGYAALAFTNAPPADAASAGGYGVGQGCWFIKDADGLHFHVGGWYHGLPALCTSEHRDPTPGR